MAPRHVGGIDGKASAAISRIRTQKVDPRNFAAKTVVEDVACGALRYTACWVNAKCRIALSGSGGILDERLIQCGVALKHRTARPVLVSQGNTGIDVADD